MKSNLTNSFLLVLLCFVASSSHAQCPFTNDFFGSGVAPTTGNSEILQTCSFIGEVVTATGVVAGSNYTIDVTYTSSLPNGVVPFVVLYNDIFTPIAWGDSTVNFTALTSGTFYTIPFEDSLCGSFDPFFGCNSTLWTNNGPSASIGEVSMAEIELFPNPTSDLVSINFVGEVVDLDIFDNQGKLLGSHQIQSGKEIDLSSFEKGIYFFNLRTSQYNETHRIIVQ